MKIIYHLFVAALVCLMVSCATQDDLKNLQQQVEQLKSGKIASIESQVSAMNASMTSLESVDSELKGYISTLSAKADELKALDAELSAQLAKVKDEVSRQYSDEKASVLASLESYRGSVKQQLEGIDASLEALKAKQSSLESQMASLKTYIDDELAKSKDWVSSTFATLEQYNQVSATISGIETAISGVGPKVKELNQQCADARQEVLSRLGALQEKFDADIQSVLDHCDSALSKVAEEIEAAYRESFSSSFSALEESMKAWVNSQLTAYSTISQAESRLDALSATLDSYIQTLIDALAKYKMLEDNDIALVELNSRVADNSSDIQTLAGGIDAMKLTVTADYEAVIKSAIEQNDGEIDIKLQEAVAATNKLVDEQLASVREQMQVLESDIQSTEKKVMALKAQADELLARFNMLLSRVQSVVPVPSNLDGQVAIANGQTEVCFEILPRSVAVELAKAGPRVFSLDAIEAKIKAITFTSIPVLSVTDNGTFLVLKVDGSALGSAFFGGLKYMNARLKIDDGNTCISSNYFPLCTAG